MKKLILNTHIYIIFILFCNCANNNINDSISFNIKPDSVEKKTIIKKQELNYSIKVKGKKRFLYSVEIKSDLYTLEVETIYLNDTVKEAIIGSPVAINQKLVFKYNDSIIKKINPPVTKIFRTNNKGKRIKSLSAVIYEIKAVKGIKDVFYSVEGEGLYNPSFSYSGIYGKEGKLLYLDFREFYRDENGIIQTKIINEYGNYSELLMKLGVSHEDIRKNDNTVIISGFDAFEAYRELSPHFEE